MPPHVHRRASRGRTRGPRLVVVSPWTVEDTIVDLADDDDPGPTRLELDQAGDILPTNPDAVQTAIEQENANWSSLNDAIFAALATGKIGTDFSFPFTNDLTAWKIFYTFTLKSTSSGWSVPSWEPMAQLDEWRKKRAIWATQLEQRIGSKLPGNIDQAPPRQAPPVGDVTGLIVAAGVLAAIVIFGPRLAKE